MTDKEQIEEMNTLMQEAYNNHCENVSCVKCPYFDKQHGESEKMSSFYCQNYLEATTLYNAGYRKVDEKFCLKHSEKDYYLTEEDAKGEKACEDCQEKVRKETAKEIYKELSKKTFTIGDGIYRQTIDDETEVISLESLKYVLKRFGVEIED